MSRYFPAILCLVSSLCVGTSFAASAATTSPVAYVYVTSNYSGSANRIVGYAAAADGKLTQVPGSPFADNVGSMVVSGKYLFGSSTTGVNIDSFTIAADGALKWVQTADVQKYPDSNCAGSDALFLDRTAANLYSFTSNADCSGSDDAYQSFDIVQSTGRLTELSETEASQDFYSPLAFIGNNMYAYEASCIDFERDISGFKRKSNGSLVYASVGAPYPTAPKNDFYCPSNATADTTNHLAVDLSTDSVTVPTNGIADQIASYTVNEANGNLTTTSTEGNMPHTAVVSVRAMKMAPSGKLLAVGGTKGLQIFHFNGAEPATVDTGLLTADEIDQVFWDNSNHLYAISTSHGKLFVFNVTGSGVSQAAGSPYTITRPQSVTALNK